MKIVRRINGPLPLTGIVLREDKTFSGVPCFVVAVYGYNPDKPDYWLKSETKPIESTPAWLNVDGWLSLAAKNGSETASDLLNGK